MEKALLDYVTEKTHALQNAPSCCAELKAAAKAWLDAVGTGRFEEETRRYLARLEADIMPVEGLLAFAESEAGSQVFGAEGAKKMAAHARELGAQGAAYCDCPACAAAAAILEKRGELLA